VTEAFAQTLTNKTIVATNNTITAIANANIDAAAAIAASKVVQATGTGIPHVIAGVLSAASSLIVNADVDAAAAIAGSKVSPAFGSQAISTTGTASFGATTITGTVTYQGTKLRIISSAAEVATTDATVTTLTSFTMVDETIAAFDVVVTAARRTNVTKGGRWKRSVVYRRTSAGAATIVGTLETGTDQETDAAWDVTIDTSTNDVRVRVTGAAATDINWTCEMRVQETLAT
jgi:hypothetical protein